MARLINLSKPLKKTLSEEEIIIKNILEKYKDRVSLSCRKISNILKQEYNISICKSKVNLILKNRLNYAYRKTAIKNSKIISKESLKMSNIFLKVILRAIKLKYELIYVDESKIQQVNSNLHCWKKSKECIFHKAKNFQKRNLVMEVSPNGLVYYRITPHNTNSLEFQHFFEGLLDHIGEEKKKNAIFIMDNLPVHVSSKMRKFYFDNHINILTNIPYLSPFNLIELSFKKLKQKLYRKFYSNIKDVIKDVEIILKSKEFINNIKEQYFDTLNEYKNFI